METFEESRTAEQEDGKEAPRCDCPSISFFYEHFLPSKGESVWEDTNCS